METERSKVIVGAQLETCSHQSYTIFIPIKSEYTRNRIESAKECKAIPTRRCDLVTRYDYPFMVQALALVYDRGVADTYHDQVTV